MNQTDVNPLPILLILSFLKHLSSNLKLKPSIKYSLLLSLSPIIISPYHSNSISILVEKNTGYQPHLTHRSSPSMGLSISWLVFRVSYAKLFKKHRRWKTEFLGIFVYVLCMKCRFLKIWIFLIVVSNKLINRSDPNRIKSVSLVWFLFVKTVKIEPINVDFIGSNFLLTKKRSKPNRYTIPANIRI